MRTFIFAIILIFSHLSLASGPSCQSIFETRESNSQELNTLVQNITNGNQALNYDLAKKIVTLSLDENRQDVWTELVRKNENKGKKPSVPKYKLNTEEDIYLAVVQFMRKEVELSLRESKAMPLFQEIGFNRRQQSSLVDAIFHEVRFLNDLRENFNISTEVDALNYSSPNLLKKHFNIFWRVFLSSFRDTRAQTYNSAIRSKKMALNSQISDPEQLKASIGKSIRLETGVRTAFRFYNRIQVALLTGAIAIVSVEAYNSYDLYKSWSDTQENASSLSNDKMTMQTTNISSLKESLSSGKVPTTLTSEESQFYLELNQEIAELQGTSK